MVIIVVTNCPPKLRGDLTKWLIEINTGVYVGNVSARVRAELWDRVCENIKQGQATMVFPADNEQHMDFRVHNTPWEPVDYDGIKLMLHPSVEYLQKKDSSSLPRIISDAERFQIIKQRGKKQKQKIDSSEFAIIDIETSGLDRNKDRIIEVAAIIVSEGTVVKEYNKLIKSDVPLSKEIKELTGITDELLLLKGEEEKTVLSDFVSFIGNRNLICHNASFDINFIQTRCRKVELQPIRNKIIDTLVLARKANCGSSNYKLETLANYYSLDTKGIHRALFDCYLTYEIFLKLN